MMFKLISDKNTKNRIYHTYLTNSPYVFKENYTPVIPLNIFQTWHTKKLPPGMYKNVEYIKRIHPLFKYQLFDDNDCREFIKNNYEPEVLSAFDTLIPGAYKADLWRYCVLYKLGGIYLDIKFKPTNGFNLIEFVEKEHYVRDIGDTSIEGVYNGVMVCKPNNQLLLRCINKIVENVKNKSYCNCVLSVTGPMLIANVMTQEEKPDVDLIINVPIMNNNYDRQHLIYYKNKCVLSMYDTYRIEQQKEQKNAHYSILWQKRQIYK